MPTLLLITTLYRLALNVSSTKLILGNGGNAGQVISTFGSFVIGSNIVVGVIVFLIIIAIQFIVITKGLSVLLRSRPDLPLTPCPESRWRSTRI